MAASHVRRRKNKDLKNGVEKPQEIHSEKRTSWSLVCSLLVAAFVIFYLFLPLLLIIIPGLATQIIFVSFLKWPTHINFQNPMDYNLTGARNFYLSSTDGIKIGLWQVLPSSYHRDSSDMTKTFFETVLSDGKPVILYFHGNSGTRGTLHRVQLYQLFSSLDYHTIAVDYRGYGDSEGSATPQTIHRDVETVYTWTKERMKDSHLYIWGHSLGTGISSVFTAKLCQSGSCPKGLILESPFNNLLDAVQCHPFGAAWWMIPGYGTLISQAFEEGAQYFQSDTNVEHISCPLMILHAEDDVIVPYRLGKKLYESALEKRPDSFPPVKFVTFEGKRGFGHKYIVLAEELPSIVREFVS